MENQNIRVSIKWEHSITNLLGHDPTSDPGIALRQWIHHQGVHSILDLLSWEEDELKTIPAHQVTEFRQPLQVQSHLEMPGILVQLGHIQRT